MDGVVDLTSPPASPAQEDTTTPTAGTSAAVTPLRKEPSSAHRAATATTAAAAGTSSTGPSPGSATSARLELLQLSDDILFTLSQGLQERKLHSTMAQFACTCSTMCETLQPRLREMKADAESSLLQRLGCSRNDLNGLRQADWRARTPDASLSATDCRLLRCWMATGGPLSQLQSIDMRDSGMSSSGVLALAPALADLERLTHLHVDSQQHPIPLAELRDATRQAHRIEIRAASVEAAAITGAVVAALQRDNVHRRRKLSLRAATMGTCQWLNVRKISGNDPSCQALSYNLGFMYPPAGVFLAALLGANRVTKALDLSNNFIAEGRGNNAVGLALAEALKRNTTLSTLKLRSCGLGAGTIALASALRHNSTLTYLDLRDNGVKESGSARPLVLELLAAFRANTTLARLRLGDNGLSAKQQMALTNAKPAGLKLTM